MLARHSRTLLFLLVLLLAAGGGYLILSGAPLPGALQALQQTELTIRWSTENEIDVAGYNLYRADTPDGEFIKVNPEPIPPSIDPFVTTEHVYVDDREILRGRTYYYLLETVDRAGNGKREGPFPISAD